MRPPDLEPRGAYGFALRGVEDARALLTEAQPTWPALSITVADADGAAPAQDRVDDAGARIALRTGGWFDLRRADGKLSFHLTRAPDHGALVHPYLAPAAALAARWRGWESFHAGAVVARDGDGTAWGVVGEREAGKSSTLAMLALGGHAVLSDDVLVVDAGDVLAGPRCVDLRAATAAHLGAGEPLGVVGARERWRLRLAPAPARRRLAGWLVLEWGPRFAAEPVRGAEKLVALTAHRALRLPPADPAALLRLTSLPCWRIRRPGGLDRLEEDVARLLEVVSG